MKGTIFTLLLIITSTSTAQSMRQEKMNALSFITGDWVGMSRGFKDGKMTSEVPAYQQIAYKLENNIITIDLKSESLELHTVIFYDEKDQTYYYNPYYTSGSARYKAAVVDGKFVVSPSETKRFIFHRLYTGEFQEYGETLVDGQWVKYFEDTFKKK